MASLGILSIGTYLPAEVRRNDWWPKNIVDGWLQRRRAGFLRGREKDEAAPSAAARRVLEEMSKGRDDPFNGVRERRVRPRGMKSSEMELIAAEDALSRAAIDRSKLDLVLTTSEGSDAPLLANSALTHERLGLRRDCMATGVDAVCNGFSFQLTFADALFRAGRIRYALLVQSMSLTDFCRVEDVFSPTFGDGATAVLVGPCADGTGLLSVEHETDGSEYDALLLGVPDGSWAAEVPRLYVANSVNARRMMINIGEHGEHVLGTALARAGVRAEDVGFVAAHQGLPWIRAVVQELIGAKNARSCDTHAWTGSLGPANVPMCLAMGEREGLIRSGDIVAGFTGGAGSTYAGIVLRWV